MDHVSALADLQGQFLETARRADPATPVPWLGRWTVQKLVVHLARIHHWAAGQARRQQETPLGRGPFDAPALYAECAAELRETLADLDPAAPAWTLLDDGGRATSAPGRSPAAPCGSGTVGRRTRRSCTSGTFAPRSARTSRRRRSAGSTACTRS